jgi:lambda repressor-like predicted transcriptional regulator
MDEVADVLHLDRRILQSLFERRWVDWETADEIAVALGCHPYELWAEWFLPLRGPTEDSDEATGSARRARERDAESA